MWNLHFQVEEKNKRLEEEQERKRQADPKMEEILETMENFEGLDVKERAILLKEAKTNNLSMKEARKSDDFLLWQKAYKEKVAQDKALSPSTKQTINKDTPEAKLDSFKKGDMSDEDREKFLEDMGTIRKFNRPPEIK